MKTGCFPRTVPTWTSGSARPWPLRWISARGRGQYAENGEPVRMLGLVQDVTPEKEAELELQATIDERNRAEEELEESRKRYPALAETDVTRTTRGTIELQRRRLELNELVRRTLEDHRTLLEGSGLAVAFEPAPRQVFIDADGNRVAQVVGNLLQNAAEFTPAGGCVNITASTDCAARQAVLRVADTGAGVAPELLERLFEPFMQADATLARSRGGLGLGLALAKELVELHGGSIEARSPGLGQGSEFTVRLPLDLAGRPPESRAGTAPGQTPRRVLVIEDSADAAESLCEIGLPGMDGYEVARSLRADPALAGTRVLAGA